MVHIAVGPEPEAYAVEAVRRGGGVPVRAGEPADGLVWLSSRDVAGLKALLSPEIRWVQLPSAGVERFESNGLFDSKRAWTSAKGAFAKPVAEHALMLALAGLRMMPERIRAHSWGSHGGESLYGQPVVVVGGGGISAELLRLLTPFGVSATVVRRSGEPMPGASRVVSTGSLRDVLPESLVVFLALALTPSTAGIIGRRELEAMRPDAWLVNVARGRHVVTDDLVAALETGSIGGAALDVTDPEPLPDGHPLWSLPNSIITPHTADTPEMCEPLLAERIRANVAAFAAGEPLEGLVDPNAGY